MLDFKLMHGSGNSAYSVVISTELHRKPPIVLGSEVDPAFVCDIGKQYRSFLNQG